MAWYWHHAFLVSKGDSPYVKKKRTLIVFDTYRGHISKTFEKEISNHDNIDFILIPGGLTYLLQPLDTSVNRSFEELLKTDWKDFPKTNRSPLMDEAERNRTAPRKTEAARITQKRTRMWVWEQDVKKAFSVKLEKELNRKIMRIFRIQKLMPLMLFCWLKTSLRVLKSEKVDLIQKFFKICGISNWLDGEGDKLIHDFAYLIKKIVRV